MNKLGVFGGTFDPVHYGHIYLVRQAVDECGLDRAMVVPAALQPFKPERAMASGRHRFDMARLAFSADDKISVSDIELKKGGVSYTVDTLAEIRHMCGADTEISFILGADAFLKIEKWKGAEELLKNYSFIIGTRPGCGRDELDVFIERLENVYNNKITTIKNRQTEVSSTEIKRAIAAGEDLSGYIPPEVERYIGSNGVY